MAIGMAHSCKKYLYVLRGIACALYIKKEKKLPPLPYLEVIQYLPDYAQDFFNKCVFNKKNTEKAEVIADEEITQFIESSINESFIKTNLKFKKTKELNNFLIKTLEKH